ncbi:hypothetical protein GOEFS_018_01080 [Gordonia effusa NBRC 100432]|uniref:Uncharacterized protein n=1 Tax=Gordonia effusa NBRC 100432 TaxID=1077974 RepID=H0QW75_9ACTN|nr:hypothetical protein [Gordonia effusa]GAB17076.1 hypothetical protein GOEFS_018_01080 [Gordonia effusa NBRC 100432]
MPRSNRRLPSIRRALVISVSVVLAAALAVTAVDRTVSVASAAPPSAQEDAPKECVGSQFATLGKVYDSLFDSFVPNLPKAARDQAPALKAKAHKDMAAMRVSTLWVSNHPAQLGADDKAPILTYRDPISQWIVTQLINVREGQATKAISVENLTLAQAVETAWLYLYVTVIVPLTIARRTMPPIGTVFGPISIGTLVTLPIFLGIFAATQLYKAISAKLIDSCIVSVTKAEKDQAGKPIKDLTFTRDVPGIVKDLAGQVMLADPDHCPSIGTLPLSRIATRTSNYLRYLNKDPRVDKQIVRLTQQLQDGMKRAKVPHNMIPADPADFNTAETILSSVLSLVPYVGGAPSDIAIGLTHNYHDGADFSKTKSLSDLSVTKSLTAAYYAYAISTHLLIVAWDNAGVDPAAQAANLLFPGLNITGDMLPRSSGIISAPNIYGLVVFHNVLRSMCLTEDYDESANRNAPNAKTKRLRRF